MFKRRFWGISIIIIVLLITLNSCSFPLNLLKGKKPSKDYYYSGLINNISVDSSLTITVLDTNFYESKKVTKNNISVLLNFLNSINKSNFVSRPDKIPNKTEYQIFFEFKKTKFVMNIYNKDLVSICPWDGKYEMDFIDIKKVSPAYNILSFCEYLIPKNAKDRV